MLGQMKIFRGLKHWVFYVTCSSVWNLKHYLIKYMGGRSAPFWTWWLVYFFKYQILKSSKTPFVMLGFLSFASMQSTCLDCLLVTEPWLRAFSLACCFWSIRGSKWKLKTSSQSSQVLWHRDQGKEDREGKNWKNKRKKSFFLRKKRWERTQSPASRQKAGRAPNLVPRL